MTATAKAAPAKPAPSRPATRRSATRGRPRRCRPDDILRAADELLDAGDAAAITIRSVAEALGVGGMTLYSSFATKGDLLDALARDRLGRHDLTPDARLPLDRRAAAWMRAYRAALHESRLFELMAAGASFAILLELATTWAQQLIDAGHNRATAVERVKLLLWSVHGFCATETTAARASRDLLRAAVAELDPSARSLGELFAGSPAGGDALFEMVVEATVAAFVLPPLSD